MKSTSALVRSRLSLAAICSLTFLLSVAPAGQSRGKAAANSASPAKIIERWKKATGATALGKLRRASLGGTVKASDGSSGTFSIQMSYPDQLRIDIDSHDLKVSECYNGKSAWRLDERGLRTLLGADAKMLRLEALILAGHLADLGRNRILPTSAGTAGLNGRKCDIIELAREGVTIRLFFDSATRLLVKHERAGSTEPVEFYYSDHRPVDGLMEPATIRLKRGNVDVTLAVDRVVHNGEIVATAFRYPQTEGSRPMPELEPLMKAITANQEKLDELREQYTCRMTETVRKLDGDGRVKETEIKFYEVTPVAGSYVERLISVNGKELSASEREKEDKRVQKEIEEILKDKEKEKHKRERAREEGEKSKDDDEITISDFLRVSEITSVRREIFRGHEVIAFDFEPRKGYKPRNRAENIISKLAGTIWVDEDARQIARLEAHLTDSFKLGGGVLASVGSSTAFAFEQEKVDGELWLPSFGEANISARVMLFAKFNRSFMRQYSDYKKAHIDSTYNLTKPKEDKKN